MIDPPYASPRHDGWTAARQRAFLEALAETANVTESAMAAGMSVSSAYRFRRGGRGAAFAAGWDAALEIGGQRLGDLAVARATRGMSTPVFREGEVVGMKTVYDNRLLMFMLTRLDRSRFGDVSAAQAAQAATAGDRYAAALDAVDAAEAGADDGALDGALNAERGGENDAAVS